MINPQDFAARIAPTPTPTPTTDHPHMPRVVRHVDKCISTSPAQPIVVPAPRWGGDVEEAAVAAAVQVYRDAGWHVVYPAIRPDDVLMVLSTTETGLDEWRPDAADPARPAIATIDEVYLVDEDSTDADDEYAETVIDTIAVFERRRDAEAYCRSAEDTGSRSKFSVRPMPLRVGPAAVYAARRNGELLGIHQTHTGAIRACMEWAGTGEPATAVVTVHRDGEGTTTPWFRTYSAAEAAELKKKYLEICERLGPRRAPWAAIDELIASGC